MADPQPRCSSLPEASNIGDGEDGSADEFRTKIWTTKSRFQQFPAQMKNRDIAQLFF
jgi:hypothetical protein